MIAHMNLSVIFIASVALAEQRDERAHADAHA
jgi:hypothetical protein